MSEYIKKTDIANVICRLEPDPDFQKKEHKFWEDISNEIFSIQGYRDAQPENKPLTLDELPAVDVVPVVRGEWLVTDAYPHRVYCSVCYKTNVLNEEWLFEKNEYPHFCMWCGAKMESEGGA